MKNREEAENKFSWGKKFMDKKGIPDILTAIEYFTKALFLFRTIPKDEVIEKDDQSIRDVLHELLKGINQVLLLSSDWSEVMDTLEKFLIFYTDSVRIFNKTHQRLPDLDELELEVDGPITKLYAKAPSAHQRERLKCYLAVISLFHADLQTVQDYTVSPQSSKDPSVIKAFEIYRKALDLQRTRGRLEPPVVAVAVPAPSEEAPPPQEAPQPSTTKKSPAVVAVSRPEPPPKAVTAVLLPSQTLSSQQPKVSRFRIFDYPAPDGPKRVRIIELMKKNEFVQALAGFRMMMTPSSDDYRRATVCQLIIGDDHLKYNRHLEAITCYIEALVFCRYLLNDDVVDADNVNSAKAFKALITTLNLIMRSWLVNFPFASKCIADFLTFYVENGVALSSGNKKLAGLDDLDLNSLSKCVVETQDETAREMTRVYLTVIGMFRQQSIPGNDSLQSMMAEVEIKRERWDDDSMKAPFDLFAKATDLVKRIKGHPTFNPELNVASEPDQKRSKNVESSSSSSLPGLGKQ